jgi:alpha-ribazole phosphatase
MFDASAPGGESFAALVDRVSEALKDIEQGTLVVCHAGPIRAARMVLSGASFAEVFDWKIPFCQPVRFDGETV